MRAPERAAAVVVAAGRGERFGAPDKVLLPLGRRPLIAHTLDAVEDAAAIDDAVLVIAEHARARIEQLVGAGRWRKVTAIVVGGERRQDSVAAGLAAIPTRAALVAVHDGARPLATPALFEACLAAAREYGAAIAAVPVADTLKRVERNRIVETVSREGLWAAQTPQAFRLDLLRRAFAHAERLGLMATDEAALVEAIGFPVAVVPGSAQNLKITRREDLELAEAVLAGRPTAGSRLG